MAFYKPKEVLDALTHAYYEERNIEAVLSCVTDDIEWVGTENNDSARGKTALKKLLEADLAESPNAFHVELEEPLIQPIGADGAVLTIIGKRYPNTEALAGFSIRGTACCLKTDCGWLVSNVHTSVPNAEFEKASLRNALDEEREKQKALLDNVLGGIAMYRVKKDGRIPTDYVSEGLARICGYDNSEDIMKVMGYDSRNMVLPEDYPIVAAACKASLEKGVPTSVHYRVCGKDGNPVHITLDSVVMKNAKLGEDDVAVFYAVQTLVSKEASQKAKEQEALLSLLNTVPAGIGVFKVDENGVSQNYMNDAFYHLIGAKREDRIQYSGKNALATTHPKDVIKIQQELKQLLYDKNSTQLDYRIMGGDGNWVWLHLVASVVERNLSSVKLHVAYYECSESKRQQLQLLQNQKAVTLAEKQGKLSIWTYNIDKRVIMQTIIADTVSHMGYPSYISNVPTSFIEAGSIHPEDIEKVLAAYKKLEDGKEMVEQIYRLMNQNTGKYDWVHMYYQRVESNSEGERMAVGCSLDVNEQQEAIERYQTEQKIREQMYASAVIHMEYNLTNNRYEGKNNLAERYDSKRWESVTIEEYRENMSAVVDECYLDEVADRMYAGNLLNAFEHGEHRVSLEYRSKARMGLPSKWYRIIATMVKRPDTGDVMAFTYVENIEEEKNREIAIESSMSDGIESVAIIRLADGQTRLILKNGIRVAKEEEKHFIYNDDFVNRSSQATVPEERKFSYTAALLSTIRKELEKQNSYQYAINTKRSEHTTRRQLFRFRYLDDRRANIIMSISDITSIYLEDMEKKKKLEDALCEAQKASQAKAEFFARVSHDMRTPMNGILGLTALSEDEMNVTVLKENLAKIDESGKYLLGIINDTLDIQRIESGKLTLNPEVVNCRSVIGTAIEMVRTTIAAKNIDFQIINKGIIMDCNVRIDPVRIKQIFVNLISNAIKFTPEGGKISFEFECLSREGKIAHDRFTVRDNGVGMSEEFLRDKIFKSYAQEQNAFSNKYAGTGLGLSIVKRLVSLMGGTIEVRSKLGVGTVFIICLDIERVEGEPERNVAVDEAGTKKNEVERLKGCRILLTEDHPLNAEIAQKLLEKVGCIVTWAKDGQACLDIMKQFKLGQFDVILMDLRMPVMDGLTATGEIRKLKDAAARSIPIIAMTANAYAEDVKRCLDSGMNAHIVKPIDPKLLYDTLAIYYINKNKREMEETVSS